MSSIKETKKHVHDRGALNSEEEIKKRLNPISITLIVLAIATAIALVHFDITRWSAAAVSPVMRFTVIGSVILLFFRSFNSDCRSMGKKYLQTFL